MDENKVEQAVEQAEDFLSVFKKFIAFILILIAGVVFRVKGLISGDNFTDLIKNCFVAFSAVAGVEHFKDMVTNYVKGMVKKDSSSSD